jgi:surface antigen
VLVGIAVPVQAQLNPFTRAGFELSPEDIEMLRDAAQRLYIDESVAVGTVETWSNPKSGNTGSVQLIGTFEHKGLPCRRLQHDIKVKDVANPFRYIFDRCKVPSGEWKLL